MKRHVSSELAYVLGILLIAMGVTLMEKADFGVSMVVPRLICSTAGSPPCSLL